MPCLKMNEPSIVETDDHIGEGLEAAYRIGMWLSASTIDVYILLFW